MTAKSTLRPMAIAVIIGFAASAALGQSNGRKTNGNAFQTPTVAAPSPALSPDEVTPEDAKSSPDGELSGLAEQALAAQKLYSAGHFNDAEKLFAQLLKNPDAAMSDQLRRIIWNWRLLALLRLAPLPIERIQAVAGELNDAAQASIASPGICNLRLQLLLHKVASAPTAEAEELWARGLSDLQACCDGLVFSADTLTALDEFLFVRRVNTSLEPLQLLEDLILLTPDLTSIRALMHRRTQVFTQLGDRAGAKSCAWLTNAIALNDPRSAFPVLEQSIDVDDLFEDPPKRSVDARLAEAALGSVDDARAGRNTRRRAWLLLLAGSYQAAQEAIGEAVQQAGPTTMTALLNDAAVISAAVARDLNSESSALLTWAERFGASETLADGADADPPSFTAGEGAAPGLRANSIREAIQRAGDQRLAYAAEAVANERDELAITLWAEALTLLQHARGDLMDAGVIRRIGAQLRHISDAERTVAVLRSLEERMPESVDRARLSFLRATLLYEQGRMDQVSSVLDEAEVWLATEWTNAERLTSGLMRSAALIRQGQLTQADQALASVSVIEGETEQLAQTLFLRGWIALSQDRPNDALDLLKRVVDLYPGNPHSEKALELILRLERTLFQP